MLILAALGALCGALTRSTRALALSLVLLWLAMLGMLAAGAVSASASGVRPATLVTAFAASAVFGGALITVATLMGRACRMLYFHFRPDEAKDPRK